MKKLTPLYLLSKLTFCLALEKRAYVTVVTSEDAVEPAMAMISSLRALTRTEKTVDNDNYSTDYLCLLLPNGEMADRTKEEDEVSGIGVLSAKKLEFAGCTTRLLSYSINDFNADSNDWNLMDLNRIWMWSLTDYDKMIYLDTDVLVIKDVTDLFNVSLWRDQSSPLKFAAAPKIFPASEFDSGLMLFKPDFNEYTDMLRMVKNGDTVGHGFDEFINDYFSDWYTMGQYHRLLPIYNAPYAWTKDESWVRYRSEIKVVHFNGNEKPWQILEDPSKFQVSKHAAPLIYVWAILMFFIANPLGDGLEEETRYVMKEIYDVTKNSRDVAQYIEKMKRGGTRKRLPLDNPRNREEL